MLHLPRFMLAAPASGSGKTTLTCGILQALADRGLRPASFKCGPDYIDPMFHTRVIGAQSRNLDTFFTGPALTRHLFARTAAQAGISVMEGVMGIFDGLGGVSVRASSYDLASATGTPVILVVNARGMSLSVIPLIQGYLDYQRRFGRTLIRGAILNQMNGMTYRTLRPQIEAETGVRLLGYVPRLEDCVIESRHLGLVTPGEIAGLRQTLERLAGRLQESLDFDAMLELAGGAADYEESELLPPEGALAGAEPLREHPQIAVARDEAFCFYYEDNLELLRELGAELTEFSPLADRRLPEGTQGLLLGGGYPELYARRLAENTELKAQVAEAVGRGMPYLAECGGFMYLHREMEDMDGTSWPMCGCIPGRAFRTPKLARFGYVTLSGEDAKKQLLLPPGQTIRGHEFHYFDSTSPGADYCARKPAGSRQWLCMHGTAASAAGYPHLYYWSNPQFALRFLQRAAEYRGET